MYVASAFKRLHYPTDVIAQCIRWYLAYSLSLRNLEEMMAERGIRVDHSTLHRWIIKITPEFTKMAKRYKQPFIKIKGACYYLYRAIDSKGKTVDFLLTKRRDTKAAHHFLNKRLANMLVQYK